MIIRATFEDNDFTELLELFFENFWLNISGIDGFSRDDEKLIDFTTLKDLLEEACDILDGNYKSKGIMDKPETEKYRVIQNFDVQEERRFYSCLQKITFNEFDKVFCIKFLIAKIKLFLESKYTDNKEMYKYLSKNIKIDIVNSVEDKDENGEVVYYFVNVDKTITF